jgi:cephalosporin hydroxylase
MENRKYNEFYPMRPPCSEKGLQDLISYINSFFKISENEMIEIGCYIGESTVVFAKEFGFVIAIDPFIDNYPANYGVAKYAEFSKVLEKFLENVEHYTNIWHIKQISDEAINTLQNKKVVFVYIDGCHTYEQVLKDIVNYKPLIVKGGFIGGHDYVPGWAGVMKAVDELLGEPDQTFSDGSWLKQLI